jgi:hypothetical protein
MLDWFKDLLRPIRRDDPDFGKMRFLRQSSTWECEAHFGPTSSRLEVLVFGDPAGPDPRQREIWRELSRHFESLHSQATVRIGEVVDSLKIDDFEMGLAAVAIPEAGIEDFEVELTYGHRSGPPQFDVRVASWQIREIIGPV